MEKSGKNIRVRLDREFSNKYFEMCKNEGYTMSKRVRKIMELDLKLIKLNINSIKELEKIININDI